MRKLLVLGATALLSTAAFAEAPPKAALCAACHGADGGAPISPTYPKIKGQNKEYLISAIKAYRAGERKNASAAIMTGQAVALTDAEIEALAGYFSAK